MKKILVPCDFSNPAINAYRFALDTAAQSKGVIYLLHVVELPALYDTTLMPVLSFEKELLNDLKADAEKRFAKVADRYNVDGVKVVFRVVPGAMREAIADFVEKNAIDLIIMGSHGVSGLKEYVIGSNTEKVVRASEVPVLVIKDYFKGPLTKMVFPNALQDEDQKELVAKVKALQLFFKAQLHVLWVNTPARFQNDVTTYSRLEAFAKRYMLKNYTLAVFNQIDEEAGILQYTEMIKGNLIAMGTKGRKGLAHLMNGSKAEDVVNHSKAIIWTYRIKKED